MSVRQSFPSDRLLLLVGRVLGVQIVLTLTLATLASMIISSVTVYLINGVVSWNAPLIAALCCISTALPVHLALRGYYRLIMRQKESLEQQTHALGRLNDELQSSNRDLKAFSHRVAHDLRNPLLIISANAQLLAEEGVMGDAAQDECLADIIQASRNVDQIINAILTLSQARLDPPTLKPVELYPPLDRAIASLRMRLRDKGITVSVVRGLERRALAHDLWLERIWVNLLDNAIKYGGPSPHIEVGARMDGDRIRCWVSDNGPGVPESVRENLLTEFQLQVAPHTAGFGLGLSLVSQLVHHMSGRVIIEDEGDMTSFVFFLQPHE
jgi:signal transduction histidine kinase